ncbi:MAG TPA: T9SS type A sorting domain-containing protein [Prolixibacteraceae bacterium]|nr:T9SS type A sorting domain-containing protein [Prolixibacteraceae bacterium]
MQYWFDDFYSPPGTGVISTGGGLMDLRLSTSGIGLGAHTLYFRFRDQQGQWSSLASQRFIKTETRESGDVGLVLCEYWLGDDYAGSKREVAVSGPFLELEALDLSGYSPGFHQLYMRFRDNAGRWSAVTSGSVTIFPPRTADLPRIVQYEYWFDGEYADRQTVGVSPGERFSVNSLPLSGLPEGLHRLSHRFRDDAGRYSAVISQNIYKMPLRPREEVAIKAYRYWFDEATDEVETIWLNQPATSFVLTRDFDSFRFKEGDHFIHFQFLDERGEWSSVSSVQFFSNSVLVTFPEISLSKSGVYPNEIITVLGTGFYPNGQARIAIQGPVTFTSMTQELTVSEKGEFTYSFEAAPHPTLAWYQVNATDVTTGREATHRWMFTVPPTTTPVSYLSLTHPVNPLTVDREAHFSVEWRDKLVTGSGHSVSGARRSYAYRVELSADHGQNWQTIEIMEGWGYVDSWVNFVYSHSISLPGTGYQFRVTDVETGASIVTPLITVEGEGGSGHLKTGLSWDYSYPQPNIPVLGVAADGTARVFLNLYNTSHDPGFEIRGVKVTLSDGVNGTDPAKLGKVQVATQFSEYSMEANIAGEIVARDDTPGKERYVFWFVAPDDFAGAHPEDPARGARTVQATFNVEYSNGASEILVLPVTIVRPPVMLVHGLGGDASAWDEFHHSAGGRDIRFLDDPRFRTCIAVNILPSASFAANAWNLTIGKSDRDRNTFQGVIGDLRRKGYAANRVDYIAHSMGGSVLRSVYDNYSGYFTRSGKMASMPYKNYERGYVNKAILIGTPHNSSPWADIVNRYAGDLPFGARLALQTWYGSTENGVPFPLAFLQPVDPNKLIPEYRANDGVINLQISDEKGGVSFRRTEVRAHLIAGDIFPGEQLNTNGVIPQEVVHLFKDLGDNTFEEFLNYLLDVASNKETDPILKEELISLVSERDPVESALAFLDKMALVMDAFNTGTFLPESDLIVAVMSQLAGYPRPVENGNTNVSIYDNFVGHAYIRDERHNTDIGNRTNELLNGAIGSSLFDAIPATVDLKLKNAGEGLNNNPIVSRMDAGKLKIVAPGEGETLQAGSDLYVKIFLQDTFCLQSVRVIFQNAIFRIEEIQHGMVTFKVNVSGNRLDRQSLLVEGFYNYPDSGVFVYDKVDVTVNMEDPVSGFGVDSEILYLLEEQIKYPVCHVFHGQYVTRTGRFSTEISVAVGDTNVVRYNRTTGGFTGLRVGETTAVMSYGGFIDTLYIVVEARDLYATTHFRPVWKSMSSEMMTVEVFLATLDGQPLEEGDEIGIFDGDRCVGSGTVYGTLSKTATVEVAVFADDGTGNGYTPGDSITYRIWDKRSDREIHRVAVVYAGDDPEWNTGGHFITGATAFVALNGLSNMDQTIDLMPGWNIISAHVVPEMADFLGLVRLLIEEQKLIRIQDEKGNTLENLVSFGGWTNPIGDMVITEGYKIKVNSASLLHLAGQPAELPMNIALLKGWNIISYPRASEENALKVVQQLISSGVLMKVQDEGGNSIEDFGIFGDWQNNIGNFRPGKGYKVRVNRDAVLTIYDTYPKAGSQVSRWWTDPEHYSPAATGNGVDHMNIHLVNIPEDLLDVGDEIGVFDGTTCVAGVQVTNRSGQGPHLSIAISAGDKEGQFGFREGNPIVLKLWKSGQDREYLLESEILRGFATFVKHESTFASLAKYGTTNSERIEKERADKFTLYPNPTTGKIYLTTSGTTVHRATWQLLNAAGQLLREELMEERTVEVDLTGCAKGVYYLKIKGEDETQVKKIVLQ